MLINLERMSILHKLDTVEQGEYFCLVQVLILDVNINI